ncbi:MAG: cupin domain-containing protein [Firmicutes bacterium]|nr:cupin domain-containing protein [Bacillota bacterium]
MQIRRFGVNMKTKLIGGHPGVYGVPIQMDSASVPPERRAALAERVQGLPILLNLPVQTEVMYFDPHSHIDEHHAPHPILFVVMAGHGTVRIGGVQGETRRVEPGEAVLWPAGLDHGVWTDEDPLEALVINLPPERPSSKDETVP